MHGETVKFTISAFWEVENIAESRELTLRKSKMYFAANLVKRQILFFSGFEAQTSLKLCIIQTCSYITAN